LDERAHVLSLEQQRRVGGAGIDLPDLHLTGARIHLARAAPLAAEPDMLAAVLEQPLDVEASETLPEWDGLPRGAVELVEAIVGAEPERASRLENGADGN